MVERFLIPQSQISQVYKLGTNIFDFVKSKEYRGKILKDIKDKTYNPDFLDINNQNPLETIVGTLVEKFSSKKEVKTVSYVDLDKYSGVWYEIARLPNNFETDSYNVTTEYKVKYDHVEVINSANRKDGSLNQVIGVAKPKDYSNSKLEVTFFWPFKGEYNIIDIGDNYEYSVVAGSDNKYLWILSRTPQMDKTVLSSILSKLTQFDTSSLIYTEHH